MPESRPLGQNTEEQEESTEEQEESTEEQASTNSRNFIQNIASRLLGLDTEDSANSGESATIVPPTLGYKRSPIRQQQRDPKSQDYNPVQLIFLSGAYAGQRLDLGLSVNDTSNSQSVSFPDQDGDGIRVGANFKNISPKTFKLKLTFHDLREDISHLAENVSHLHEITDGEVNPPLLLYSQGDLSVAPLICTSINSSYQHPHAGDLRGYRYAEVDIELKLLAGKSSPHALGAPLTGTPLGDYRQDTTVQERQQAAQEARTELLLEDCLGSAGSEAILDIVNNNQQADTSVVGALDAPEFVQGAIAGVFSTATLTELEDKVKRDVAAVYGASEDGIQRGDDRQLANALYNDNPSSLSNSDLQSQYDSIKDSYDKAVDAILKQEIGADSKHPLYDTSQGNAYERFLKAGRCGLSLRQAGAPALASPTKEDQEVLKGLNQFLENTNDDSLAEVFGVSTPEQIEAIRSGHPYESKQQFINDASTINSNGSITGYSFWHKYAAYQEAQENQ